MSTELEDLFDLDDAPCLVEPDTEGAYLAGYADGVAAAKDLVSRAAAACEKGGELKLGQVQALVEALGQLSQ